MSLKHIAIVGLLLVVIICTLFSTAHAAASDSIKQVRAAGPWIEIEVQSAAPFPVRAEPPVLQVGKREFRLSRSPADGSLDILIFLVTPAEFAKLSDGDEVSLHYGQRGVGRIWNFGRLNKGTPSR